ISLNSMISPLSVRWVKCSVVYDESIPFHAAAVNQMRFTFAHVQIAFSRSVCIKHLKAIYYRPCYDPCQRENSNDYSKRIEQSCDTVIMVVSGGKEQ
ncbi:MAG: hypothetical protein IKP26_06135, partial [Clostridia bacterium]|nr:hypothetical protein [Clostridia bacterium]